MIDGSLAAEDVRGLARHARSCDGCATYLGQLATTAAVLASRGTVTMSLAVTAAAKNAAPIESDAAIHQSHRALTAIARAADPSHADDLVQETWDHFLNARGAATPTREQLTEHLLGLIHGQVEDHEVARDAWATSLIDHHPHDPADLAETDLPADPASFADLRALADRDALDADGDQAELLFPELYGDRPDVSEWASPPVAWPTLSRILSPEDEAETSELYSVVDEALEELSAGMADAVYVVDIEGHSLPTASGLLGRDIGDLQRDLRVARNHLRGRVDAYLTQR
ncbi:hypothetical protein SAMN04487968_12019 [Nocardioides terrae]|uniref:Uncharacterized protein n=1 Tax=Nocardioides terrae TaxID=574651 RepID=A0A1I1NTM4_9ACTN|nr:hypothetical protein [Nocardioides terrae]SFD00662.1 hypothetical protein SAMN04487968_12019 [Nocardioides terrae]